MNIDWPLAIELAVVFAVLSYVRWRWFKSRMRRLNNKAKSGGSRPPEA